MEGIATEAEASLGEKDSLVHQLQHQLREFLGARPASPGEGSTSSTVPPQTLAKLAETPSGTPLLAPTWSSRSPSQVRAPGVGVGRAMVASKVSVEEVMDNLRMITLNLDRNFDAWKPDDAAFLACSVALAAGVAKVCVFVCVCVCSCVYLYTSLCLSLSLSLFACVSE